MPDMSTVTDVDYFFKEKRISKKIKNLLGSYKARSPYSGATGAGFILNLEELASLYHFPDLSVKAPMIKKTTVKKTSAPISLPVGGSYFNQGLAPTSSTKKEFKAAPKPKPALEKDMANKGGNISSAFTDVEIVPPPDTENKK